MSFETLQVEDLLQLVSEKEGREKSEPKPRKDLMHHSWLEGGQMVRSEDVVQEPKKVPTFGNSWEMGTSEP